MMFFYHVSEMVLTSAFSRSQGAICFDIVRCCAVLFKLLLSHYPLAHSMLSCFFGPLPRFTSNKNFPRCHIFASPLNLNNAFLYLPNPEEALHDVRTSCFSLRRRSLLWLGSHNTLVEKMIQVFKNNRRDRRIALTPQHLGRPWGAQAHLKLR